MVTATREKPVSQRFKVDVPAGRSGDWQVQRFTMEKSIQVYRLEMVARAPVIGETYTQLIRDKSWGPMMSDTPAEIRDLAPARFAFKKPWVSHVLINGLGLGVALKMALEQPHIEHIDVVEIEPDIIKLVAPSYPDPRVHIHEADAYTIEWPKNYGWSVAWHDIWPDICADNLEGMGKLHRKYGKRVQWQGSWQRENLKARKRREGRYW